MTVWIYVDTRKQVGDVDHLKVFASEDAAQRWFAEHDPEGSKNLTATRSGQLRSKSGASLRLKHHERSGTNERSQRRTAGGVRASWDRRQRTMDGDGPPSA
jgi:hypothetical protein